MFNPPPKLSYAKVRNKSKNKNQASSQQKIVFDNEASTDIFAHLNQDNLNYIKKQIKNKKAQIQSHNSQQVLSIKEQVIKVQTVKNQEVQKIQQTNANTLQKLKTPEIQRTRNVPAPLTIMTHSQRVYEKYKNKNEVIETDPQYQQTLRQTEVDDTDLNFMNQKMSPPSFSPKRSKKQKTVKVHSSHSSAQQKSPMVIISQQYRNRKVSKDYTSRSPRKLSIQQTERFKTYNYDHQVKNNLTEDMFASVSNGQKIQKLSQLNLNPYPVQTNDFLYFLQSYIEDISQNQQFNQKNSIQKMLRRTKSKDMMQHSSDIRQYHLKTDEQAFKKSKKGQSRKQVHTYRPVSRKLPLQSNERQKYTQNEEIGYHKNSQLQSEYQYDQNSDDFFKERSQFKQHLHHLNDRERIKLLQKELYQQKKDSIILARQLQKYKFDEDQQKREIYLLSSKIQQLNKQVTYFQEQLLKINQKNLIITKMLKQIQEKHKMAANNNKFKEPIQKQKKISQEKYCNQKQGNFHKKQFLSYEDKNIQQKLNLNAYRSKGAKQFYENNEELSKKNNNNNNRKHNIQSDSEKGYTLRKQKQQHKVNRLINENNIDRRSKGSYKKFDIGQLEEDYFNERVLLRIDQLSSRKKRNRLPQQLQLQNLAQIKKINGKSLQKLKHNLENFRSQRQSQVSGMRQI